jgi:mono/diheme cytochrome c family protein
MEWITNYAPQPYPAQIDRTLAATGQGIYVADCARCHGTYDAALDRPALTSFPNWEGDVGTYLGPPLELTQEVADAVNGSGYAPYLAVRPVRVRTAPPLTGLWASAPYLANGSVPTLWHLMRPEARPREFAIGGHALDMDRVGIALAPPVGYAPWADTGVIDTTVEGFSNAGHAAPFDQLSEADKDALLEYLKLL